MFVLLFLLLPLSNGNLGQQWKSGATSAFSGATSRTVFNSDYSASKAIDGNPGSNYHSDGGSEPQWLKLTLARHHSRVDKVVCEIGM